MNALTRRIADCLEVPIDHLTPQSAGFLLSIFSSLTVNELSELAGELNKDGDDLTIESDTTVVMASEIVYACSQVTRRRDTLTLAELCEYSRIINDRLNVLLARSKQST
jgi:hypothetical protein